MSTPLSESASGDAAVAQVIEDHDSTMIGAIFFYINRMLKAVNAWASYGRGPTGFTDPSLKRIFEESDAALVILKRLSSSNQDKMVKKWIKAMRAVQGDYTKQTGEEFPSSDWERVVKIYAESKNKFFKKVLLPDVLGHPALSHNSKQALFGYISRITEMSEMYCTFDPTVRAALENVASEMRSSLMSNTLKLDSIDPTELGQKVVDRLDENGRKKLTDTISPDLLSKFTRNMMANMLDRKTGGPAAEAQ